MSIELTYLTLTALLAASLWIPYIVGVNKYEVDGDSFARWCSISDDCAFWYRAGKPLPMGKMLTNNNNGLARKLFTRQARRNHGWGRNFISQKPKAPRG